MESGRSCGSVCAVLEHMDPRLHQTGMSKLPDLVALNPKGLKFRQERVMAVSHVMVPEGSTTVVPVGSTFGVLVWDIAVNYNTSWGSLFQARCTFSQWSIATDNGDLKLLVMNGARSL